MEKKGIAKAIVVWVFFLILPILAYSESEVTKLKNTGWKLLVYEGMPMEFVEQTQGTSMYWCFYDESHFVLSFGASAGVAGYLLMPQGKGEWRIEKGKIKIMNIYYSYSLANGILTFKDDANNVKFKFQQITSPTVKEIREGGLIMN